MLEVGRRVTQHPGDVEDWERLSLRWQAREEQERHQEERREEELRQEGALSQTSADLAALAEAVEEEPDHQSSAENRGGEELDPNSKADQLLAAAGADIRWDPLDAPGTGESLGVKHTALAGSGHEMHFVQLTGGQFTMGSPEGEVGRLDDEGPQHRVYVSGFLIAESEVTQGQWEEVRKGKGEWAKRLPKNPSSFTGDLSRPVERVSWCEALIFANALSEQEERTPAYSISSDCEAGGAVTLNAIANGYRLPTEAQWEYAARAGTNTPYWLGSTEANLAQVGWYLGNSGSSTHPVCTAPIPRSPFDLCDVHGNVWEWIWGTRDAYTTEKQPDPVPPLGDRRVIRGGSCYDGAHRARSAYRFGRLPRGPDLEGFRLVASPPAGG